MIFRFSVVMAALSLAGCATITRGTNDVLVVESTPQAAQVKLSNGQSCDGTPCSFKLPRKSELNLVVSKEGCKPVNVHVTNRVSGGGGAAMGRYASGTLKSSRVNQLSFGALTGAD